ncbi:hypothetical protein D9M71_176320 [compost metagenome]
MQSWPSQGIDRQGRLPLGGGGAQACGLRRPGQQGRARTAGRRLRAVGLPDREPDLAQRVPVGRL